MAIAVNLVIVVLEIVSLLITLKAISFKKSLVFYTQISNMMTLVASALLVIFGDKGVIVVLRYLSVCMLVMTFFVTAFILVPMSGKAKELLFSGSGLYHHLLIPIISTISYLFIEIKAAFSWVWLPVAVTLFYGILMVFLNYKERVEGPYPFFRINVQGIKKTILWMLALLLVIGIISAGVCGPVV